MRDFDRARDGAKVADAALVSGERRPLLGIPMVVKESFNVAALPTTWGIPTFKTWTPKEDAVTVARLKAAGAVILGKTNVPIVLGDWQSYNDIYGTTNNPWDLGRTPGGSSGGSAAALAAAGSQSPRFLRNMTPAETSCMHELINRPGDENERSRVVSAFVGWIVLGQVSGDRTPPQATELHPKPAHRNSENHFGASGRSAPRGASAARIVARCVRLPRCGSLHPRELERALWRIPRPEARPTRSDNPLDGSFRN